MAFVRTTTFGMPTTVESVHTLRNNAAGPSKTPKRRCWRASRFLGTVIADAVTFRPLCAADSATGRTTVFWSTSITCTQARVATDLTAQGQQQVTSCPSAAADTRLSPAGAQPMRRAQVGYTSRRPHVGCRTAQLAGRQQPAYAAAVDRTNELQQREAAHRQSGGTRLDSVQRPDQLLKVQTSLASDLRQVVGRDTQIDLLAKTRCICSTMCCPVKTCLSQLAMDKPQLTSEREKTSRSPPFKQRRIHPQQPRPGPQEACALHISPPHPPSAPCPFEPHSLAPQQISEQPQFCRKQRPAATRPYTSAASATSA